MANLKTSSVLTMGGGGGGGCSGACVGFLLTSFW